MVRKGHFLQGMAVATVVVFLAFVASGVDAFTSPFSCQPSSVLATVSVRSGVRYPPPLRRRSGLSMAGFLDDIGKFFEDMGKSNSGGNDDAESGDEDSEYYGTTRVLTIPVDSLKIGGLRLYLAFYLMGEQNTPDKGSWRSNQVGDSGIDVYYQDRTGALMLNLDDEAKCISIDRLGSAPSNAYLMQESAMIGGLLDELDRIASDEEIDVSDRLIQLAAPGDAIENARETLAFS